MVRSFLYLNFTIGKMCCQALDSTCYKATYMTTAPAAVVPATMATEAEDIKALARYGKKNPYWAFNFYLLLKSLFAFFMGKV